MKGSCRGMHKENLPLGHVTAGHPLRTCITVEVGENGQIDQTVGDKFNAVF